MSLHTQGISLEHSSLCVIQGLEQAISQCKPCGTVSILAASYVRVCAGTRFLFWGDGPLKVLRGSRFEQDWVCAYKAQQIWSKCLTGFWESYGNPLKALAHHSPHLLFYSFLSRLKLPLTEDILGHPQV